MVRDTDVRWNPNQGREENLLCAEVLGQVLVVCDDGNPQCEHACNRAPVNVYDASRLSWLITPGRPVLEYVWCGDRATNK